MRPLLQFAFSNKEESHALLIKSILEKEGYQIKILGELDPKEMVILFLNKDDSKESLQESFPWLKKQEEHSSYKNFRVMPFIAYHSKINTIDELWEEGLGDLYESIFSGEFKPFGWDLDDLGGNKEFERVLEEYL